MQLKKDKVGKIITTTHIFNNLVTSTTFAAALVTIAGALIQLAQTYFAKPMFDFLS